MFHKRIFMLAIYDCFQTTSIVYIHMYINITGNMYMYMYNLYICMVKEVMPFWGYRSINGHGM